MKSASWVDSKERREENWIIQKLWFAMANCLPREKIAGSLLINYEEIINLYKKIIKLIIDYINSNVLNNINI